jgi:hypothetical protein
VVSPHPHPALHIDSVLTVKQTFGAGYLAPQSILDARVAKISFQFDW